MGGPERTLWLWKTLPRREEVKAEDETWRKDGDAVENVDRLHLARHPTGSFGRVSSGTRKPYTVQHDLDLLGQIANLVKPGGRVTVVQAVGGSTPLKPASKLVAEMKLAGLVELSAPDPVECDEETLAAIRQHFGLAGDGGEFGVVEVTCKSPDFEPGSSQPLSFAAKAGKAKAVWNLEDVDDEEVELVDPDSLIDEEDAKKPDAASLRVCGTTGKRKACKDCSCGLADELAVGGKEPAKRSINSSCGSCYLGDAFRCASCPYLGMPAFKPGEKIQLSDRQLNPDQ